MNEKTYPSDLTDEEWEWIKVCFARKVGHFANKIGRLAFQSRKEASARSVGRRKQPGMIGVYNKINQITRCRIFAS